MTKIKAYLGEFKNNLFTLNNLILFIIGAVAVLALSPFNQWYLMLFSFAFFFVRLSATKGAAQGFAQGFAFAAGFFVIGLYWISNALFVYWEDYWWAYPGALLGLPLFLSLFWAITAALIVKFSLSHSYHRLVLFVAGFATIEWIRGWIFTGFPWNLSGYAWSSALPIAQLSAYGGIFWLTLLTILWASLLGFAWIKFSQNNKKLSTPSILMIGAIILTFSLSYTIGQVRLNTKELEPDKSLGYLIVQPNIPQKIKWQPELIIEHLEKLIELSTYDAKNAQELPSEKLLIVWPETAMVQSYFEHPRIKTALRQMLKSWPVKTELLSGMLHIVKKAPFSEYYNSLYYINNNAELIKRYDKSHLVPFGEYIPFIPDNIIVPLIGFSGFVPGVQGEPIVLNDSEENIFPLICYEIIFPRHLALRQNNNKAAAIITVTNDAWYGNSPGPYQHHAMAKFRAIEQGLPVIRSANTGISGAFDSLGRQVIDNIGYNKTGTAFFFSPKSLSGATFYAKYGNLILFSTLGILYFLFIVLKKRLY